MDGIDPWISNVSGTREEYAGWLWWIKFWIQNAERYAAQWSGEEDASFRSYWSPLRVNGRYTSVDTAVSLVLAIWTKEWQMLKKAIAIVLTSLLLA